MVPLIYFCLENLFFNRMHDVAANIIDRYTLAFEYILKAYFSLLLIISPNERK